MGLALKQSKRLFSKRLFISGQDFLEVIVTEEKTDIENKAQNPNLCLPTVYFLPLLPQCGFFSLVSQGSIVQTLSLSLPYLQEILVNFSHNRSDLGFRTSPSVDLCFTLPSPSKEVA